MKRALAAALALVAVVPIASGHLPPRPGRPCPGETAAVQTSGQWETIRSPLDALTSHAAGGIDGKRVLATDGRLIMRSGDGGCTWKDGYDTGAATVAGVTPSVESVTFPGAGDRAFAVLAGVGRAGASRLLASDDGGATWRDSGTGLPSLGGFRELTGAGDRLYLTVETVGLDGALYTSADGGRSWSRASTGDPILRVAVDPLDADTIYIVRSNHNVARSTDAGASFAKLDLPATADEPDLADPDTLDPTTPDRDRSWRDIAVGHRKGKEAVIVVAAAPTAAASVTRIVASNDSGRSFLDLPTDGLGPIGGLTFGNSPSQILFVAGSDSTAFRGAGLLAFDLGEQVWRDVDDLELGSLREPRAVPLSVAARGHKDYDDVELRRDAASGDDLIARYTPPDPPPGDAELAQKGPCGESIATGAPTLEQPERVSFAPAALSVDLQPGQATRVPLAVDLRAVPSPLDVYFVIDSSESMDPAIDGVKCSAKRIVRQLSDQGIDAWFGVGTYNDRYDTRYERRLDLRAPDKALGRALGHLFTRRGKEEPIRTALMQTATGAGLDIADGTGAGGAPIRVRIPEGQQADFRDDALHTAIVIGDEPYEETTPGEPAVRDIIAALRKKDILTLGVQVQPPFFQPLNTRDDGRLAHRQLILRRQLEAFAAGSGAVAPRGGVDCDGGGAPDIASGQPLVCSVRQEGIQQSMSDTLVALLADLQDFGDVRLVPRTTSGLDVSVEEGTATHVDLKHPSALAGTAVVSCGAALAGRTVALSFAVEVGRRTVGELAGTARCGAQAPAGTLPAPRQQRSQPTAATAKVPNPPAPQPAGAPPLAPQAPPQPAIAVPPPPAPPTPALVPSTPAGATAGSAAPASVPGGVQAAVPAPGAAAAPEAAPAPRLAHARVEAGGEDYAMVATSITLGIGFCAGFGWLAIAADRRRRPNVTPARVRR